MQWILRFINKVKIIIIYTVIHLRQLLTGGARNARDAVDMAPRAAVRH